MSDPTPNSPQPRRRGLLWLLFVLPGTVILWWQYQFPQPGEAWASARRKDEPVMKVLYSLAFWLAIAVVVYVLASAYLHPNHAAGH